MLVLPILAAAASLAQLVSAAPTPIQVDEVSTIFEEDVTPVEHTLEKRRTYSCASTTDCKRNGFPIPEGGYTGCNKKRGICVLGCNSGYTLSGSTCKKNGGSSSSTSRSDVSCSSSSQCKTGAFAVPSNGYAGCNKARGKCVWACNSGYVQSGSSCVKKAGTSSNKSSLAASSSSSSSLDTAGIKNFRGTNDNAILSWYDTNSGTDSTNGRGWCEFQYTNSMPGFAPSLNTMLSNFGYDAAKAKQAYCGLEAVVTTADGRSATLYIMDAFDDSWVRTPSSLDLIHGAFTKLWGSNTYNKNDVFTGASWHLTGNRASQYGYRSSQYQ